MRDLGNNLNFRAGKQGFYPLADDFLVVGNKEANLGFGWHAGVLKKQGEGGDGPEHQSYYYAQPGGMQVPRGGKNRNSFLRPRCAQTGRQNLENRINPSLRRGWPWKLGLHATGHGQIRFFRVVVCNRPEQFAVELPNERTPGRRRPGGLRSRPTGRQSPGAMSMASARPSKTPTPKPTPVRYDIWSSPTS